jgi:CDP-diacylglycerol--serine O-phosphatidyltransferase
LIDMTKPTPLRHVADLVSLGNALCGVVSCAWALAGRADVSLVLLVVGAVLDGLDGAAARRFGGTRLGVFADDVADAVSYAIAPGVAVAATADGAIGGAIGACYAALTIARLVFFTLDKGRADNDPRLFRGLPSTVGGVVVLSVAALVKDSPAAVAFAAGVVTALMVTFDASYEHLGRAALALARRERTRVGAAFVLVVAFGLATGALPAATLAAAIAYLSWPSATAFARAVRLTRDRGAVPLTR